MRTRLAPRCSCGCCGNCQTLCCCGGCCICSAGCMPGSSLTTAPAEDSLGCTATAPPLQDTPHQHMQAATPSVLRTPNIMGSTRTERARHHTSKQPRHALVNINSARGHACCRTAMQSCRLKCVQPCVQRAGCNSSCCTVPYFGLIISARRCATARLRLRSCTAAACCCTS